MRRRRPFYQLSKKNMGRHGGHPSMLILVPFGYNPIPFSPVASLKNAAIFLPFTGPTHSETIPQVTPT